MIPSVSTDDTDASKAYWLLRTIVLLEISLRIGYPGLAVERHLRFGSRDVRGGWTPRGKTKDGKRIYSSAGQLKFGPKQKYVQMIRDKELAVSSHKDGGLAARYR